MPSLRASATRAVPGLFVAAICMAALVWVTLQGEDTNWDRRNYHFYTGYALLNGRFSTDIGVADQQTFFNPYVNAGTFLATYYLPFPVGAWVITAVQLISVPLLFAICLRAVGRTRRPADYFLAMLATTFGLLSPTWISELGTSFTSATTAPFILGGVLLILRYLQADGNRTAPIFLAGLLLGLGTVLKLTNAPFAFAAFLALAAALIVRGSGAERLVKACLALVAGGLVGALPSLPWHVWLATQFQNPVFPFYNQLFRSDYFAWTHFRDLRWRFSGFADFFSFIVSAASRANRTGEIEFADARWLMLALLMPSFMLFGIPRFQARLESAGESWRDRFGTLVFLFGVTGVGIVIWAALFAYQRYLIPVELLFGPVALLPLVWMVPRKDVSAGVLGAMLLISLWRIEVPDWEHSKSALAGRPFSYRPFDLQMPEKLRLTPARYLIFGLPNSFLVPFLHDESVVARGDLSSDFAKEKFAQMTALRFAANERLPLRLIGHSDAVAQGRGAALSSIGISATSALDCQHFGSAVGAFVACDVLGVDAERRSLSDWSTELNFAGHQLLPNWVISVSGLSVREAWGRWSEGGHVTLVLAKCLPAGRIAFSVTGHAFGPNIGVPIIVRAGAMAGSIVLSGNQTQVSTELRVADECVDRITVVVPHPMSPKEVGLSTDQRKIGVGLSQIRIELDSDESRE